MSYFKLFGNFLNPTYTSNSEIEGRRTETSLFFRDLRENFGRQDRLPAAHRPRGQGSHQEASRSGRIIQSNTTQKIRK